MSRGRSGSYAARVPEKQPQSGMERVPPETVEMQPRILRLRLRMTMLSLAQLRLIFRADPSTPLRSAKDDSDLEEQRCVAFRVVVVSWPVR